jgi:LEA14-like dessication related protein
VGGLAMKKNLTYGAFLAGLCLALGVMTVALSGCSTVAKALNIENPRYSLRDIRPRIDIALPLSASSIDFDFTLGVENPNGVGLNLSKIDFAMFVNDSRILDTVSEQGINIPANGMGDVRLRARVGYSNIRSLWSEVVNMIQGNRARYEVRGNAYYNTPVGLLKFPVTVYSTAR